VATDEPTDASPAQPGPRAQAAGERWPPHRIVLATANPGKTDELAALLAGRVEVLPRPPDVPDVVEDADTLVGNARRKAVAISSATGLVALADDTGLEVDALGGRPGVRSARYAGEDGNAARNVAKLLRELSGVPEDERTARFRTVLVLLHPDGRELVADGVVEGTIARASSGDGGFGYDPVFVPQDGDGRTFAAMSRDDKAAVSHRGRALRSLVAALDDLT
jgi:XTP/dITP diphosphohydrolase